VLGILAHGEGERATFREILLGLRHRAFGFTTLVFALPCVLPMPPGIPTICGIALMIIGLNLIAMRRRLWLPSVIADKSVARADLQRMADRVVPHMQRLERFCKPRFPIVTEAFGKVLIGLVVAALGFIMILPIPFVGNMPPVCRVRHRPGRDRTRQAHRADRLGRIDRRDRDRIGRH
jgi:hypothetical protein